MNVSMIQVAHKGKAAGLTTSQLTSSNGFETVLSRTIETANEINLEIKMAAPNEELSKEEQLQSLLEFLQIEDRSQLENNQQLAEELLFAAQDQQLAVIFEHVGDLFNSESLEEFQQLEGSNILLQLHTIVNQALNEGHQQDLNEGIKLAKIFTLFRNVLDLSGDKVMALDELKQKLEQLAVKLETLLIPKEKSALNWMMNKSNAFAGQLNNADYTAKTDTGIGAHNPFMNMSKLEQFVLNTQIGDKGAVNSEQLLKSFENIISKAQFTNQNGMQKLLIKLNPEHLGSLRIEIIQQNGTMIAKIIASTQQAKELLDSQLQGLKQSFVNQNIPVEKLELAQQFNNLSQERNFTREQGQQNSGQADSEDASKDDEQITEQFKQQFEEALLESEV